jgi:general L-amino acid transport system substrate-binding protein
MRRWINVLHGVMATMYLITTSASATPLSPTLAEIEARGSLRCGVTDASPGFATSGLKNDWSGFDIDICRAIAAVIFDDPAKVTFVHLAINDRFDALLSGKVDMLARVTATPAASSSTTQPERHYSRRNI